MDALWYNYDLTDPRDTVKCIKQIEKVCRDSLEYDDWQKKCKYKDATECPICGDNYYENNSKCESHHHPKTLFDIVEEVLEDHLEKNDLDEITGIALVQEVMDLHLFKKVSYINLCQHCHKKYHAGHPEVQGKIAMIFEKRIKDEIAKEVVEEVEEIIIIETQDIPIFEVPEILKHKDFTSSTKPEILNIETSQGFISIDLDL